MEKNLIRLSVCILLVITVFVPGINATDRIGNTSSSKQELVAEEAYESNNVSPDYKSATEGPDEKSEKLQLEVQDPPSPAGFGKFYFTGGFGVRLWGWCTTENYNTMTVRWEEIQGKIARVIPFVQKHSPMNGGIKFFYWYIVKSIVHTEFRLYLDYEESGSPRTITLGGNVVGYLVWSMKYL